MNAETTIAYAKWAIFSPAPGCSIGSRLFGMSASYSVGSRSMTFAAAIFFTGAPYAQR